MHRLWTMLVAASGCYDLPQPDCGFSCGPAGQCPSSYSCNAAVNRCELTGSAPSCAAGGTDAGRRDTTSDVTAPRVISQGPPPNAIDVGLAVEVHVRFDEPVVGYLAATFQVEHLGLEEVGPVMYDPVTYTLTRQFPALLPDTDYTVTVTPGISDAAGNGVLASWTFRTVDTRPPTTILRAPTEDNVGVSVGADIFVDFSERVTGVSSSSFTLVQGGMPVTGNITYSDIFGSRARFNQTTQLLANTLYTVNLTSAIQDTATTPNPLMPVSWSFTTGPDQQSPAVATRRPMSASTDVAVMAQVVVSFDEPVLNVTTTSFTLTPQGGAAAQATVDYAASTRIATLTPTAALTPATQYTATLTSAIEDAVGNPLAQLVWSFTTAP